MIVIEFWNGMTSKKKKYIDYGTRVTTKHNPCLWSNVSVEDKPWCANYDQAILYIELCCI
mgnify:CR=1 FL=1